MAFTVRIGDLTVNRLGFGAMRVCGTNMGIASLPWYPLGGGAALKSPKVKSLAKKHRARPAQIALAWLLAKSPVVLPIPGTADLEHLEENAGAAQLTLSPDEMRELN